ncbi:MAG TPA: phage portal protein [Rhizomicrobium sp.]|nr:phage portal protein [Rhizomicrobium sp.]
MALFERMFSRASGGVPSYGMIPPLGSVQSATGLLVSQATAMGVSTVFACVNRLATDLARCRPSLFRLTDDGSKEPVLDHPLLKLFQRPNAQQTWFEFAYQTWAGFLLRGNGYAACKRDGKGNPEELIPINPDAVMVLETSEGSIFYNVNRIGLWQIAMLRDFPTAIAQEDILHLRGLTFNSLVGVSTIGLGRDAIGLAMALEQQGARWLANGARPSTWLSTDRRLSDATAKRLKTQFDDVHAGIQNTGKTLVLEEGLKPNILQLNSVDLQYDAQRKRQVEEICRFYGVPPRLIGYAADTRGANESLAAQSQEYVNSAIMQRIVLAEEKLAQYFELDKEGISVALDEGQLLRADVLTRYQALRLGITSSVITPDEGRRSEGLKPKGGQADELQYPANSAAMGSDKTGTAPDGAGHPEKNTVGDGGIGSGNRPEVADEESAEAENVPAQN